MFDTLRGDWRGGKIQAVPYASSSLCHGILRAGRSMTPAALLTADCLGGIEPRGADGGHNSGGQPHNDQDQARD